MSSVVENSAILPGENLIELLEACKDNKEKATIVGPGLKRHSKNKINSHAAGQLLHRNGNLFWINSHQRYYIPCERDTVVGVVTSKFGNNCRVDIGASEQATLSLFAFPNATKRNKGIVEVSKVNCNLHFWKLISFFTDWWYHLCQSDGCSKRCGNWACLCRPARKKRRLGCSPKRRIHDQSSHQHKQKTTGTRLQNKWISRTKVSFWKGYWHERPYLDSCSFVRDHNSD